MSSRSQRKFLMENELIQTQVAGSPSPTPSTGKPTDQGQGVEKPSEPVPGGDEPSVGL